MTQKQIREELYIKIGPKGIEIHEKYDLIFEQIKEQAIRDSLIVGNINLDQRDE